MKNYTITVNGNVYNVTVEEGISSDAPVAQTAVPKQKALAPKKVEVTGGEGSVKVSAPMPGKILSVKVSVGQQVKKDDVLVVLEAMKMENEIVAPNDGTVASVNVASADSVEAGAILATLN